MAEHGADPNVGNDEGDKPLHIAVIIGIYTKFSFQTEATFDFDSFQFQAMLISPEFSSITMLISMLLTTMETRH